MNNNLARLIGPALGGGVAALLGLGGVALLDAASFLFAALLLAQIHDSAQPERADLPKTPGSTWVIAWHEWQEGLRVITSQRRLRVIFGLMAVLSLGEGMFAVLFVIFVNRMLGGGALEIGWLMSAQAVGGLLGGVLVGWFGNRVSPTWLIGLGSTLFGVLDLAIFNVPQFSPLFLPIICLFVAVGIPGVIAMTGVNTVLQTAVGDTFRGRVFGALGMITSLLALLGTALAGLCADAIGVVTILNLQGAVYIIAGLATLALLSQHQGADESRVHA